MCSSRYVVDFLGHYSGSCDHLSEASGDIPLQPSSLARQPGLAKTIELEVIPRLMLSFKATESVRKGRRPKSLTCSPAEISEFARISVNHDVTVAQAFVDSMVAQGASMETVFTQLLAPAARRLGELWESDAYTFSDVTVGLSRIQQLIHKLSPAFEAESEAPMKNYSALLMPMPGEHHSLGILVVEEFFRRAGWNVWTATNATEAEVATLVRQEHFDTVGISVTCQVDLDKLHHLILEIRRASLNKQLMVIVGGRVFSENPQYAQVVGADATDVDGRNVVATVERLAERAHRRDA